MHCEECGLVLDSVSEDQIIKANRFAKARAWCPKHAEQILGVTA